MTHHIPVRRIVLSVVLLTLTWVMATAAAFAATTLTFSEFPVETSVAAQYVPQGVLFSGNTFITRDSAQPTSPVLSGTPRFQGPITATFVAPGDATQRVAARNVTFDAGFFDAIGETRVIYFDASGNELGRIANSRTGIQRFTLPGSVGSFRVEITGTEPAGFAIDNLSFDIVQVATVEFQAADSPLTTNPNAGGGQRMFPDKQNPTDTTNRKVVRVRATTGANTGANVTIYFRAFDMDDPSSDTAPVDPNSATAGDNRGTPNRGTLSAASAKTDVNGVAQVEFTVTMQPGDNFRVAASTNMAYLNGVVEDSANLKDARNSNLPTDSAKVTPMLTVWRRVHIELDSMGAVTGNNLAGMVTTAAYNAATNRTGIQLAQVPEPGRFQNGRIVVNGVGSFRVVQVFGSFVQVSGNVTVPANTAYTLYDDDDFNNDDGAALDGDEGEDVTAPDTSLIQDSDSPASNVFAPAYVRPTYDIGDNNNAVPFVLNVATDDAAGRIATYDFDQVATEADNEFWTVYLLGAYQYVRSEDKDPNSERATFGVVDAINGRGASVYNEVLRAVEATITAVVNNAATTGHEIGHLFNGLHEDLGLMSQSGTRTTTQFSDVTIDKIRSINHP